LQDGEDEAILFLGAASVVSLKRTKEPERPAVTASRHLAETMRERNAARLGLWEAHDDGWIRLLGAAAAISVFGKGNLHAVPRKAPAAQFDLPEAWHARLAALTAAEAVVELDRLANDPRLGEDERATAELAADAVRSHPGVGRVSFAEASGLPDEPLRTAAMRPGRLYRAAPRGKSYPARLTCRGARGRLVRCRAVADARGALTGYLAYDPLSREIGGRPLFAAYGLDGRRNGYAWADEPAYWRAGAPQQGFRTAPESIDV
jgi:hypothetical protein